MNKHVPTLVMLAALLLFLLTIIILSIWKLGDPQLLHDLAEAAFGMGSAIAGFSRSSSDPQPSIPNQPAQSGQKAEQTK